MEMSFENLNTGQAQERGLVVGLNESQQKHLNKLIAEYEEHFEQIKLDDLKARISRGDKGALSIYKAMLDKIKEINDFLGNKEIPVSENKEIIDVEKFRRLFADHVEDFLTEPNRTDNLYLDFNLVDKLLAGEKIPGTYSVDRQLTRFAGLQGLDSEETEVLRNKFLRRFVFTNGLATDKAIMFFGHGGFETHCFHGAMQEVARKIKELYNENMYFLNGLGDIDGYQSYELCGPLNKENIDNIVIKMIEDEVDKATDTAKMLGFDKFTDADWIKRRQNGGF